MRYAILVTTYIRDESGDRVQSYQRTFWAHDYARAKQLETDLTFSSEVALDRIAWQEAYICAYVRVGRESKQMLVPLNEVEDVVRTLSEAWEQAMNEKIGPRRNVTARVAKPTPREINSLRDAVHDHEDE